MGIHLPSLVQLFVLGLMIGAPVLMVWAIIAVVKRAERSERPHG